MRHRCRVPHLGKPADQRKALLIAGYGFVAEWTN
jgi:hypothetical protein